jgi:ABC-type bacteriocin/lantibiotic exporter with double-glycine peptidase domain
MVTLTLPIGIQAIINLIQGGELSTSWVVLVIFVILGIVASGVLQVHQLRITENLQQKIFTRAAFEFAYRIPKIRLEALYKHYAPELMNRFFDVVSIQKGLSKILIDFSTATIQTVFGLTLLSFYHPFFIVFSLTLVILVYAIFKLISKRGLETSLIESKNKYNIAHWLEELARSSVSFKLAGKTELPLIKTNTSVQKYIDARDNHFKILKSQYILMVIFKVLVASGLLIAGSFLVIEQQMNIGQFVAAEIIILMVINAVEKLIFSLETIYDVLTSLEKVGQVTDLELENTSGEELVSSENNIPMRIDLKDVCFSYPEQKTIVLNNINLSLNPGEKLLIRGDGDSGKTTLLYLLAGLYKAKKGALSYDDLPIGNYNPSSLRSQIGDCFVDEMLFEATVLENITMGRENASLENVKWAISNLGLTDFIQSLPQGYNTIIHSQGQHFSQSVQDRLILARGIADKPRLLLVKDFFTSLAPEERENIVNFLTDSPYWTLIVASKDDLWRHKVDRVVQLKKGVLNEINKYPC